MRARLLCAPLLAAALVASRPTAAGEDAPRAASEDAPPDVAQHAPAWKVCDVALVFLLNSEAGSEVVAEERFVLFHGTEADVEREIPVRRDDSQGLLRVHARVRAVMARPGGVTYHVTTEGVLAAAVGFDAPEVGREEYRHSWLEIDDTLTHLHEAFASPSLAARVVLAVTARPRLGAEPGDPGIPREPDPSDLRSFRVEAELRRPGEIRVLAEGVLTARPGSPAELAFGSLGTRAAADVPPAARFGPSVVIADVPRVPWSDFGRGRTVTPTSPTAEWGRTRGVEPDDEFLEDHVVKVEDDGSLRRVTLAPKARKLSKRKQAEVQEKLAAARARREAIERAKHLPGEEVRHPDLEHETLLLRVEPLVVAGRMVQLALSVAGGVRLPSEPEITPVDIQATVELAEGQSYEVALVETLRGGRPEYDYVLRVTPLP